MKDLTLYTDNELSLQVFNDLYFYNERHYQGKPDYVVALCKEEFVFTPKQLDVLLQDLQDDLTEQ